MTNPTARPKITARDGVLGRHIANPSAGAKVPMAENDTAPISASTSLPPTSRLYAHASSSTLRIAKQLGSATCRERVGQYVLISVCAAPLKKKKLNQSFHHHNL